MISLLRRVLTRTLTVAETGEGKEAEKFQIPPNPALLYGVTVAIIFFIGLIILEAAYMFTFHEWSSEIFSAIMFVAGTVVGAFFGRRAGD